MIKENVEIIKQKIETAAKNSGRSGKDILLLGVTKTIDIQRINELIDSGVRTLGENKPQEILKKYDQLKEVKWHLIGHLQSNKVKHIIDKVELIHSVDSIKLALEIDKQAKKHNKVMDILIEVNIAGEDSKHGIEPNELEKLIKQVSVLPNIRVKGIMTVAPFVENPQNNRLYFEEMNKLFIDIKTKNIDNIDMTFLSMGMTNDYEVAIEEGANIVRIGTAIFGKRKG